MTTLKIAFFFMYFKMQELGAILWRIVKWGWKDVIKDILWHIFLCLSAITLFGAGILGVLFGIFPVMTKSFIMHGVGQAEGNFVSGIVGVSFVTGFVVLFIAALGWVAVDVIKNNWYKVPLFLAENWEKATIRVTGEK